MRALLVVESVLVGGDDLDDGGGLPELLDDPVLDGDDSTNRNNAGDQDDRCGEVDDGEVTDGQVGGLLVPEARGLGLFHFSFSLN